jgi:hypothetical protein
MNDDQRWNGRGPSLEAAFEDAWHQAKQSGQSGRFIIDSIGFEASNPIHAYIVVIKHADG